MSSETLTVNGLDCYWPGPVKGNCRCCEASPATDWFCPIPTMDANHGGASPWCRRCILVVQIAAAEKSAARLEGLRAELLALDPSAPLPPSATAEVARVRPVEPQNRQVREGDQPPTEVARVTLRGVVVGATDAIATVEYVTGYGQRVRMPVALPGASIGDAVTIEVRKG